MKTPSQTITMTDDFLYTHPKFKDNLPSLYRTTTTYDFRFPQDRNSDHYVSYAFKKLGQISI